tara:strand:+ start:25093 stop:25809 length:717 start_codon:yes stop_codon:yes gene_type:complete
MAKDPGVDADKLKALTDIQSSMISQMNSEKDREAKARFDRAFALACADMPVITKDEKIEHNGKFIGWFKKYEDIRTVVDQIARPYGLTTTHDSSEIDGGKGGILVWTVITYVDSEYTWTETRGKMPVPPDTGGAKGAGQALGSSTTYGQRYSIVGAYGIVQKGLDRDGASPSAGASLSKDQLNMLDAAQKAATGGPKDYGAWLNSRTNAQKGWMITNGHHDKMAAAAREIAAQQQGQE